MRDKIYKVLNKIYGATMTVAFFGGVLPLIPFIVALIMGGTTGEKISLFLYEEYYPWVLALASISVVIGLITMYIGKQQALSAKSFSKKKSSDSEGGEPEQDDSKTDK